MRQITRIISICGIILAILNHHGCDRRSKKAIEKITKDLVPKYLPGPPEEILEVVYPLKVRARLGNQVHYEWIKYKPNVTWTCDPNERYTLLMIIESFTDPDNYPIEFEDLRCFTTWLVINIRDCDINKGLMVFDYDVPKPHWGLGRHPYLYTVFKQPVRTLHIPLSTASESTEYTRIDLNLKEFIRNQSLGNPYAANWVYMNGTLTEHLHVSSELEWSAYKQGVPDYYGLPF